MCGRYDSLIPRDAMVQLFGVDTLPDSNFPPRYNIAPTQDIAIVRPGREGGRELLFARWGLVPFWMEALPKQPHINARAETVERTPLFREAFAARRCLIPATGFYEWEKREDGRQPYRFRLKGGDPFAFAGLWESARIGGEKLRSATIIVTDANDLVGRIHNRMPVILPPEAYTAWLDPDTPTAQAKALLKPLPPDRMESYPVSRAVNHYEMDDEECIRPVALEAEQKEPPPEQHSLPGL